MFFLGIDFENNPSLLYLPNSNSEDFLNTVWNASLLETCRCQRS